MSASQSPSRPAAPSITALPGAGLTALLPGLSLCAVVGLSALALERAEAALFGRAWLGALVLAILLGTVVRAVWAPAARWQPGISFSGKALLELAVMLLGASVSAEVILSLRPDLLLAIVVLVAVAVCGGYGIGRLLGLPPRMALLVACGNAICGNSAIMAVAPLIGAKRDEIASAIAFTAVLGVLLVLGLPLLVPVLGLSGMQLGVLAGVTVYAVPQVLAATAPAGALAVQIGTIVKLARVLMLGPVVLVLSLLAPRMQLASDAAPHGATGARPARGRPPLHRLVPWFILGFLGLATLRSLDLLPRIVLEPIATTTTVLSVLAMAALGLGVELRMVARAGGRVTAAVTVSLLALGAIGLGLIRLLGIA